MHVLVLWVDPCKDTQEILLAMASTPKTASHAESSPAPQASSTPSSCRPPSSSPPSSAKAAAALPAATTESVEGGNQMAEGDKDLLIKALAKIEELESRLETASNTSVRGKDDEKEEEKDEGKEGGTRNRGRRNATKAIDAETAHKQAAISTVPNKITALLYFLGHAHFCPRGRTFCG